MKSPSHPKETGENIKELYRNLMQQGYKPHEIDQIDIHYFLELIAKENEEKKVYIDQIW